VWENPHDKFHLTILNRSQDIDDLRFVVFLTVHGCFVIFGDAKLTVHSFVQKDSKCIAISRLSLIVNF
jgi:hypothetical protein